MATYLQLTVIRSPLDELHPEYGASRITLSITDSRSIDPAIFVFQRHVSGEATGFSGEFFYSIAGLTEMANLPSLPSSSIDEPFYRSATVTLDFASNTEADGAVLHLREEIALLVSANDRLLDQIRWETEVIEFGSGPNGP